MPNSLQSLILNKIELIDNLYFIILKAVCTVLPNLVTILILKYWDQLLESMEYSMLDGGINSP